MSTALTRAGSAPQGQWGARLLLTAGVLALLLVGLWGMRRGWIARQDRQADVPAPPDAPMHVHGGRAIAGQYVATTTAGDLLDRIVAHGLGSRGRAQMLLSAEGALIRRVGEGPLWIPRGDIRDVRLGSGQAQKAFERGGLILITWSLGGRLVDTGFRADDPDQHLAAASELELLATPAGGTR